MALLQYRVPALERMMVAFSSLLQESWWSLDPNPSMKLDMQVCQVLLPVLDILLMEEIWRSPVEVGSLSPLLTGFFTIWSDQSPQIKRHPGLRTTMISYMRDPGSWNHIPATQNENYALTFQKGDVWPCELESLGPGVYYITWGPESIKWGVKDISKPFRTAGFQMESSEDSLFLQNGDLIVVQGVSHWMLQMKGD